MMEPRLESSKKWTSLPEELIEQVKSVLVETFDKEAEKGEFVVAGRIYPEELIVRIGYIEEGRITQANGEVSITYNPKKDNIHKLIGTAVDCAGGLIEIYFENPEEDFPREWQEHTFDKRQLFLKFTTVNDELEKKADEILGQIDLDALVKGEDVEIEIDAIKDMLGISDEDDDKGSTH